MILRRKRGRLALGSHLHGVQDNTERPIERLLQGRGKMMVGRLVVRPVNLILPFQ